MAQRAANPADATFLRALFGETRGDEFASAGLTEPALTQLLDIQYRARCAQLTGTHPHAATLVIEAGSAPVGALVVDRSGATTHLVDITVAAAHRGHGIGTAALQALVHHADAEGRPVTLNVWALNTRAVALYERLGFCANGNRSGYASMRREAGA